MKETIAEEKPHLDAHLKCLNAANIVSHDTCNVPSSMRSIRVYLLKASVFLWTRKPCRRKGLELRVCVRLVCIDHHMRTWVHVLAILSIAN